LLKKHAANRNLTENPLNYCHC